MRFIFKTDYDQDIRILKHSGYWWSYGVLMAVLIALPWLVGGYLQSQMVFVFIYAMVGEELGLLGAAILLLLYLFIVGRAMYLAVEMRDTFARLLAGSLAITFFVYVFINAGMVSGLLPVVGVPLPLVSYGGTSMVTLLAGFGILMSLYSHRKLVGS